MGPHAPHLPHVTQRITVKSPHPTSAGGVSSVWAQLQVCRALHHVSLTDKPLTLELLMVLLTPRITLTTHCFLVTTLDVTGAGGRGSGSMNSQEVLSPQATAPWNPPATSLLMLLPISPLSLHGGEYPLTYVLV
ncbi:hypothetical protein GDO81_022515 [Engystomops pustulosus]|uniref:Uncharacterized protein n=1 Tax=Engystomops pustulosus TaxID=76066 RepID=A0AAV6ZEX7_ENGPU|nr:hypothetical protein GDO81_022515 [Engystomops pustulosus]